MHSRLCYSDRLEGLGQWRTTANEFEGFSTSAAMAIKLPVFSGSSVSSVSIPALERAGRLRKILTVTGDDELGQFAATTTHCAARHDNINHETASTISESNKLDVQILSLPLLATQLSVRPLSTHVPLCC
jgi:hypothetical protein